MQKGILIVSVMVLFLTFCSAVAAHPGHGTEYPEEINITTPDPAPAQTTTSTGTSSSTSKSSAKKNTASKEDSGQISNTNNQNSDNQAENQPVEEVTNTTEVNASSDTGSGKSESSPLNTSILIGGFIAGFAAVGLLIKSGLL